MAKFVALVTRTLKEGKTYDDYRRAWFHSFGFGVPTTMYTVVNVSNPREITSIGIVEADVDQMEGLLGLDVKDRLANPLDDVIESSITRTFGLVAAVDDFSPAGALTYVEPSVDGVATAYDELAKTFGVVSDLIASASRMRDTEKAAEHQI